MYITNILCIIKKEQLHTYCDLKMAGRVGDLRLRLSKVDLTIQSSLNIINSQRCNNYFIGTKSEVSQNRHNSFVCFPGQIHYKSDLILTIKLNVVHLEMLFNSVQDLDTLRYAANNKPESSEKKKKNNSETPKSHLSLQH